LTNKVIEENSLRKLLPHIKGKKLRTEAMSKNISNAKLNFGGKAIWGYGFS
jgi:hypothetical protein